VDFEQLTETGDRLTAVYVSGVRADDLALRFNYADIPVEKIHAFRDNKSLIDAILAQNEPAFIMPTYTAMLNLRNYLSRTYGFKQFWE
jgi:hypothetical protein